MKNLKAAVCQIKPLRDRTRSLKKAVKMIKDAAENGAGLVVLPEIFYHPYEMKYIPSLEETESESRTLELMRETARQSGLLLCTGSIVIKENGKRFNRSYLIGRDGEILLRHDKTHLFDVSFKDLRVKESAIFSPGENAFSTVDTEIGKIGILICYDIRFPEAARKLALQGAEIIIVPAAFNNVTGPAHWDLFFRTRAVENQVFMVAASPARDNSAAYLAYGHSMMISPWGTVLAEAKSSEKIIYADFSAEEMDTVRGRMPLLKHRRPEFY